VQVLGPQKRNLVSCRSCKLFTAMVSQPRPQSSSGRRSRGAWITHGRPISAAISGAFTLHASLKSLSLFTGPILYTRGCKMVGQCRGGVTSTTSFLFESMCRCLLIWSSLFFCLGWPPWILTWKRTSSGVPFPTMDGRPGIVASSSKSGLL
jgi:hypothetical protein